MKSLENSQKKDPIEEATIEFRLAHQSNFNFERIESIGNLFASHFPQKEIIKDAVFQIPLKVGASAIPPSVSSLGYKFNSQDDGEILMVRTDTFSYHCIKPYMGWSAFCASFLNHWQTFNAKAQCKELSRVGVRFINNLNLPVSVNDYGDFLSAPPSLPGGKPHKISDFLSRIVIPLPEIEGYVIIYQALNSKAVHLTVPVILDIDVYSEKRIQIDGTTEFDMLEKLRQVKNEFFFNCITEKTKGLYTWKY
jgi:uncharacterized protein (TIGR04255 family)